MPEKILGRQPVVTKVAPWLDRAATLGDMVSLKDHALEISRSVGLGHECTR